MRPGHRHLEEGLKGAAGEDPSPMILEGSRREKEATTPEGRGDKEEAVEAATADMAPLGFRLARKSVIFALMTASFLSFVLATILYAGNVVDNLIHENLVIRNSSQRYDWWKEPPVRTLVKIKLFNYTNVDAYLKKIDRKLKVQEVGPYVYRVRERKVNVEFPEWGEGDIVSFQMNRSYEFVPELSPGVSEDDLIVSPDFNLLSVASALYDSPYTIRFALRSILTFVKLDPFKRRPVGELLWGYDDPIFDSVKGLPNNNIPISKFGLMAMENGVSPYQISVHTGLKNSSLLGVISEYNGEDSLPFWGGQECNRLDGVEGSVFPRAVAGEAPLKTHLFTHHLCRRIPLLQKGEVGFRGGIRAVRFEPPEGLYDSPDDEPDHRCYCNPEVSFCPPSGAFNISPCAYGVPVMISFPHFYAGHPSLVQNFEGLDPVTKQHEFYLDIEPTLGVPLRVKTALQMNILVRTTFKELAAFPPNLIMPLLWAQSELDEVPDYLADKIKFASQTSFVIENALICTFLSASVIFAVIVVLLTPRTSTTSQRPKQSTQLDSKNTFKQRNNTATQEKV